jgi:hypothetical protein
MSTPPLVPLQDNTPDGWRRKVRDSINRIIGRQMSVGIGGERPANPDTGTQHYDTDLLKPVWWDGATWRDAGGNEA